MEITIDNICQVCEKGSCEEPCEKWYDCFEGKPVDFGFEKEKDDDEN